MEKSGIIPFCPLVAYGLKMTKAAQSQDRFIVRLPDGMRDRIAELAKASGRSMNAEIVARLEQTMDADDQLAQLQERISDLESQVENLAIDTEKRVDRVEERVWRLLEHAGLYDSNPEK